MDIHEPIKFRESVEYNGKVYLEITEQEVPGIVPGRYFIAQDGEIYTKNKGGGIKKHRLGDRYLSNEVRLQNDGRRTIMEHLVLMQVYNTRPNFRENKLEINHKNGDKYYNEMANLEWVSHKENMDHAYETGLNQNYCENNVCAYLTNDQVREICIRLRDKTYTSYVDLAEEFGCAPQVIMRINVGKAWRRISEEVGLIYNKRNKRFTDEEVHKMCQIFVELKNCDFQVICNAVISRLHLENNTNTRHKIKHIYYKRAHYFTRISDQYDY